MKYAATVLWTNAGILEVATEAGSETEAKGNIEQGKFEMIGGDYDMPRDYEITDILDIIEDPTAAAKAKRAAAARKRRQERAAKKKYLKPEFEEQYELARSRAMGMAEAGQTLPIHFNVRVSCGSVVIEKRFTLTFAELVSDCFTGEPVASNPNIVVRKDSCSPAFVQESIQPDV